MSNFKPFIRKFEELIKKEGFSNINTFVDKWIKDGGSFRTLHQWLLLKDIEFDYHTIYASLRPYLTVPYNSSDSFWNKWNATAQSKGFETIDELMEIFKKKYTNTEIANELGVTTRTIEYLRIRLDGNRELPLKDQIRKKRKSQRDEEGFTKTDVKEKWGKLLSQKGFKSLSEASTYYINNKMPISKMAHDLGVTEKALKIRLEKAGILMSKETVASKNSEGTLGLL